MYLLTISIVFVLLLIKHYLCDHVLRSISHNIEIELANHGFFTPELVHIIFHVIATLFILTILFSFYPCFIILILFEGCTHYLVDLGSLNKKSHARRFCVGDQCKYVWWLDRFDQWTHFFTYLIIIAALVSFKIIA